MKCVNNNPTRQRWINISDSTHCLPVALGLMLVIAAVCNAAIASETTLKPNVLFIAVDDLKPILGCYGDTTAITPSIDRLAARGTVFLNAQCQWPVCGPTRASLMTSLRPEATGVMDLKTSMRAKNPDVLTLPQHFRNNGYATAGAGKIYDPRCVDDKKTLDAPSWSVPFAQLPYHKTKYNTEKRFALAPDVADEDLADGQIALSGLGLMRQLRKSDQPFFLAVGFKKPHLPFIAPKKYWNLYRRDQFKLASHQGGIKNASGHSLHNSPEFRGYEAAPKNGVIPDELQREAIHGYYACTSYIDTQIGLLLDELDKLGLRDNTIVVLWGDHGFHLGDHGMWGKHSTLEQAARVPLIICPPNGKATRTTSSPVEFTDIFPTLCEFSGLEMPKQIAGRSLVSLMDGTKKRVRDGALTVFKSKGCTGYLYRTERYRYTEWINNKFGKIAAAELYDYETDPLETKNLASEPKYGEIRSRLAEQMRADGQGCDKLLATKPDEASINVHSPAAGTLAEGTEYNIRTGKVGVVK
jgi:iduronate 2-sulfatase